MQRIGRSDGPVTMFYRNEIEHLGDMCDGLFRGSSHNLVRDLEDLRKHVTMVTVFFPYFYLIYIFSSRFLKNKKTSSHRHFTMQCPDITIYFV